ncbi:MAG: hypothetical protein R2862_09665 [Thermoanaerobaculia bacterium]
MFIGLRRRLLPGGVLVLSQRNWEAYVRRGSRSFRSGLPGGGDGALRFGVALDFGDEGLVSWHEAAWSAVGREDRPRFERHRTLQGWRSEEIRLFLELAQFRAVQTCGGFAGEPFDPDLSDDLVVVAS